MVSVRVWVKVSVKVRGICFFSRGSALLSEVREVKTPPAGRQPKHVVSHFLSVECVASCISSFPWYKVENTTTELRGAKLNEWCQVHF